MKHSLFLLTLLISLPVTHNVRAMDEGEFTVGADYLASWQQQSRRNKLEGCGVLVAGAGLAALCAPQSEVCAMTACGLGSIIGVHFCSTHSAPCTSFRSACACFDGVEEADLSSEGEVGLMVLSSSVREAGRLVSFLACRPGLSEEQQEEIARRQMQHSRVCGKISEAYDLIPVVMD